MNSTAARWHSYMDGGGAVVHYHQQIHYQVRVWKHAKGHYVGKLHDWNSGQCVEHFQAHCLAAAKEHGLHLLRLRRRK